MTLPASDRPDVAPRVFSAGRLSIGLTLPLLRSGNTVADFNEQLELAALADALGFRALWIRDVPLNSADYPDPVGHLDPWVLLGALASRTRRIVLASGAIVLPLRHPLHIAKGALSVATLSGGRFVLGLGSGDRPPEYAAFGVDAETRRDRYRQHWEVVAAALGVPSRVLPDETPPDAPDFTLLPRDTAAVPMLAVGSGGQSVDWIARNAIGWMTYHRDPDTQRARHSMWRAAVERLPQPAFRAFGVSMRLDLDANRDAPATALSLGYATGRRALIDILHDMQAAGTHHVTLNPGSDRAVREIIEEIAEHVLPVFHDEQA
ncbi:LLM class oxidoreductase [Burkholderia cepacia]|uniref:Luciferase family protein n=1 Tax=Burkholderia cepacia GG4 TaxID=1009846 RepID=A0A9W3K5C0_BURCE|nr:LLM class oxidoreductase [Burkholderia cepacia]AFQ51237.1 luciferase family protein [Burkholderia cepacia GG4]